MITTPFCDNLHALKYRGPNEDFREACNRQANAMKDSEEHYKDFRSVLLDMRFMPGGRVQAAMGSPKRVTAHNCFLSGSIEDSFVDGPGCIMDRVKEAAATMRMGGGIGYSFSGLRPKGALITKLDSVSSGPVSFMGIFNAVCKTIASSGHRRGAEMGVLRVDHPDIEEFIHVKQNETVLKGFNLSIGITDEFMRAVQQGSLFRLRWGGKTYCEIDARNLWEKIMRGTWDWAEPGVLFIDTINEMNNLWYCERIEATNPCGELPLPANGSCLLGSFNLVRYLYEIDNSWYFNYGQLAEDIPHVVRAMDNVIDRSIYPLEAQKEEAKNKRRMGLGITGLANCIEKIGPSYGSAGFIYHMTSILELLRDKVYHASVDLGKEKGSFPFYRMDKYREGQFIQTLPIGVQEAIEKHGIRNSHLLSIAPTGTISLCADNISPGIEPVAAYTLDRTVEFVDGPQTVRLEDYGYSKLGVRGKVTAEVTIDEHLAVLTTAQKFMDSAVSKTCNVSPDMPWEEFKDVYMRAWKGGAKGCTTFNIGGKRFGILNPVEDEAAAACKIDVETGLMECE